MSSSLKIIVSVSSDLSTDQRVLKICSSLTAQGNSVTLIGRQLKNSKTFLSVGYTSQRINLWFNKGFLFYASLNVALFFKLLFSNSDVLYANDLDTLLANYLVSKIKGKPLIYDSHEYFTEVPELIDRPSVQRIWKKIEAAIVPRLKNCITVTPHIADVYEKQYGVQFNVMRNFPLKVEVKTPEKENFILYQGALNIGRGLEELIAAMPQVNSKLWIAGTGDIEDELRQQVHDLELTDKVEFLGRLSPIELEEFTLRASLGVSIEHKLGLNYTFALPNKVFDYIHCQTPVLYSDLVEVKKVLNAMEIGEELKSYDASVLSLQLNEMLVSSEYSKWQSNCNLLKEQLNWQKEEKVLLNMIQNLG